MPIYEYVCKTCGNEFEALVRGEERPECPSCGATQNLERQMSVPSAHTLAVQTPSACPASQSCGMPNCCGQGCGLGGLG